MRLIISRTGRKEPIGYGQQADLAPPIHADVSNVRGAGRVTLRWPFNDYLGVSDMWRLPKNAYFLLQSKWTETPMVHVVGHWTWPEQQGPRSIRVYSNCDTVELLLNDQSLGVQRPAAQDRVWEGFRRLIEEYKRLADRVNQRRLAEAHLLHPPFIWDDVRYRAGTLLAVGVKGKATVRHELRTAADPERVSLRAQKATLSADGRDVSFIEADVVDRQGTIIPTARPWITFAVKGPARLLGGTTQIDAISGVAAINVQSTIQAEEVIVEASSPGLRMGSVRLKTVKKALGGTLS